MMVRKEISEDILRYFAVKKGYSATEIAKAVSAPVSHIDNILKSKEYFTIKDVLSYIENSKMMFWEFAIEALDLSHLPEKTRKRVLVCQQLAELLKKRGCVIKCKYNH